MTDTTMELILDKLKLFSRVRLCTVHRLPAGPRYVFCLKSRPLQVLTLTRRHARKGWPVATTRLKVRGPSGDRVGLGFRVWGLRVASFIISYPLLPLLSSS